MHACMVAENTVWVADHAVLHGMSSQLLQQHSYLLCADQEGGAGEVGLKAGVEGEAGVPQLQQGVQATLEVLQK